MIATLETELVRHLHHLAVNIGSRPVGSRANRAAGDYIASVFREAGLAVEQLPFDCPDWTHTKTVLELDGERLTAGANAWSLPCDVTAPTISVCTLAELEAADLSGKIAVLYGELAQAPLTPTNWTLYTVERDQKINALLEAKQPAAVIMVNQRPVGLERLIEDKDLTIPSATVPAPVGLRLLDRAGAPVHLRLDTHREDSRSFHVIGRKAGAKPERIVLCAHFDSKIETPAAWDNASGVAALLALAGLLGRQSLPLGLELVAFADEEYLGNDDREYMRCCGDQMGTILTAINFDGVGYRLGATSIMIAAHSEPFQRLVDSKVNHYPGVTWVEPWPQSNHSTFAWRGVPSLAVSSTPWSPLYHTPEDTIDWVSGEKLAEAVSLVMDIVTALQDKPLDWIRPAAE
ncbi:MAG: M28 family peptidase [Chloroflexi bacterium]|nr:M28 family peptidase [Chloroflexota bacterium]